MSIFLICVLLAHAALPSIRAQQSPDLSTLVADISKGLDKSRVKNVVGFDFTGPQEFVSAFGRRLADQFDLILLKIL